MAKTTLNDVGSLANAEAARTTINDNADRIEQAFDNTVSRDGSGPNEMLADFDMNGHSVMNTADPVSESDAVNLRTARALANAAAGGTLLPGDLTLRADLDLGNSGKGADLVAYKYPSDAASKRSVKSRLIERVSVKDFGAKGDGVTDDAEAFQQGINAVALLGERQTGGELFIPAGDYIINAPLTITRSVRIVGEGMGDFSPNPNGTGGASTWLRAGTGLTGLPMIRIQGSPATTYLFEGEISNVMLWGAGFASKGIHASGITRWRIDVKTRDFTAAGVHVDDAGGIYSPQNIIRNSYLANVPAADNSHGTWIEATPGSQGAPQNIIDAFGFVKNGDALRIQGFVDNCIIVYSGGFINAGTGKIIAFRNASDNSAGPGHNFVQYCAGGTIHSDSKGFGNSIAATTSETTTISINAGGQMHYNIQDYVTAGRWETNSYLMTDEAAISSYMLSEQAGAPVFEGFSFGHKGWKLRDSQSDAVGSVIPVPVRWRHGKVTAVTVYYSMASPQTLPKNAVFKVGLASSADGGALDTNAFSATAAVALTSGLAGAVQQATIQMGGTFSLPVANGGVIAAAVQRLGSDAGDTAVGDLHVMAVKLHYQSQGPQSGGSGTLAISPMGT